MNVDNQTILHIHEGQVPPKELLERILASKPTVFGGAVQEADGAGMYTMREDAANLDFATLSGFLEDTKHRPRTLYFGKLAEGISPDSIQPITITNGEGDEEETFMSIFCEGDIVGHNAVGQTEQFLLVNGVIIPKIIEWCSDFDGDMAKVMAKINGEVFNKDLLTHIGHRGVLHILPQVGDAVLLGPNKLSVDGDWGWVSQSHGFGEAVQEPVVTQTKKQGYWKGGGKTVTATAEPAKPAEQPATPPAIPADTGSPVEPVKTTQIGIEIAVKPPSWLVANKDVQEFYVLVSGKSHPGWKKRLPVTVKQNHELLKCTNLKEYEAWKLANLKTVLEKQPEAPAAQTAVMANNKATTKQERLQQQQEKPATPGPSEQTDLPIIGPKDLEKVLDFMAKHLDGNSKEIMPPQEMQAIEKALPKFSAAVGLDGIHEYMNWPTSGWFGLAATDARAPVIALLEVLSYARPYIIAEMKNKAKTGQPTTADKVVTTKTDLGNGSAKTESVVVPAAGATTKKKSWGYGNKNKAA